MEVPAHAAVVGDDSTNDIHVDDQALADLDSSEGTNFTLDASSYDEGGESGAPEPVDSAEEPPKYRVEIDGRELELTAQDLQEMYKGHLRLSDYTRKTQELKEWYRRNEDHLRAMQVLNTWMYTNPDKAERFQKLLFGRDDETGEVTTRGVGQPTEQIEYDSRPYYSRYNDSEDDDDDLDYQAATVPARQQQSQPNPQAVEAARLQALRQQQWQEYYRQQAIQQMQDQRLDYELNRLRSEYGDYNEKELLLYMQSSGVYNPEAALQQLRSRNASIAQTKPQARVESSRGRGATRGVKAQTSSNQPVKTNSWQEAANLAMQEFG